MKIIMIHGRAQEGKDPIKLQQQWEAAMNKGFENAGLQRLDDIQIEFPFYGDKLEELLEQLQAPLIADFNLRGATLDSHETSFRGELLEELAGRAGISDDQIQHHYSGQVQERGLLNWEWVHSILKALDSTPLGEAAIDTFTRDVYAYLTNPTIRRTIENIVAEKFKQGPYLVIGHSLGSVVGYNVLRALPSDVSVVKYITVGSPLGLKAIKTKLEIPLKMPDCTSEWTNAFDDRDVVALYPLDNSRFPTNPTIYNIANVKNHTDNRHGIAGYLDNQDVAKQIHNALTTSSVGD